MHHKKKDKTADQANLLFQCGELLSESLVFHLHVIYIRRQPVPNQLVLPVSVNVLCTYKTMNLKLKDNKNVYFFCCV